MENLKLSSPWVLYFRKVEALFEQDPDVTVEFDDANYELKLYVESAVKAEALQQLLPEEKEFGNVKIKISVIPADTDSVDKVSLIRRAFAGNPALVDVEVVELFGKDITYFLFEKEVVQYYSDDLSDIHGITSTLYQTLAREVIGDGEDFYFCTDVEVEDDSDEE